MGEARVIDKLTNIVVEETLFLDDGSPMMPAEAVDELTGTMHSQLLALLPTASEIRIAFDGVRVKRYLWASELRALAAKEEAP